MKVEISPSEAMNLIRLLEDQVDNFHRLILNLVGDERDHQAWIARSTQLIERLKEVK